MAQVNLYSPTPTSWWLVRVWARLLKPKFTHCNFENGWGTVVDLGRDMPRGTHVKEAYILRPVNGAIMMVAEKADAMDKISIKYSKKRTTTWRNFLYLVTGLRLGEIRNCATITSDWLTASDPSFPRCYTPDQLWKACHERTHTNSSRWLRRMGEVKNAGVRNTS